jgi:hypothetical protein
MDNSRSILCLVVMVGALLIQAPAYAKMYRWADENGRVFYSDKVPPTQSKFARKELSDTARVTKTIKAAKTVEQIALEARLEELRLEQEKIIAKQKANDKVLLSTFRNIDDLKMTLKGKLLALDAQQRVHERTIKNLKENLAAVHKKAANVERRGYQVPANMLSEMAKIEDKMAATYRDIDKLAKKRALISAKFAKDIERFSFLTRDAASTQALSDATAEMAAADALGLFNCQAPDICRQAWGIAKQFVQKYSTTAISYNTETLIMGADPVIDTDLSLSVSKLTRKKNKVSIFLDIRCHKSTLGDEMCQSNKVKKIRSLFKSYIEGQLQK